MLLRVDYLFAKGKEKCLFREAFVFEIRKTRDTTISKLLDTIISFCKERCEKRNVKYIDLLRISYNKDVLDMVRYENE